MLEEVVIVNAARTPMGQLAMPVVRTFDTGTSSFGRYSKALDADREIVVN